jgi:hypothetical protein
MASVTQRHNIKRKDLVYKIRRKSDGLFYTKSYKRWTEIGTPFKRASDAQVSLGVVYSYDRLADDEYKLVAFTLQEFESIPLDISETWEERRKRQREADSTERPFVPGIGIIYK